MSGFVSLVGAGPGDPGLLTLAGRDRLAEADVVVYDRLVNPALLNHAPEAAERVFAGKSAQDQVMSQDEINALLIERAQDGKRVVRLKGGDAFVFGRGGEEALALAAARVPFEVVPGVTSAIAAPAYAGVPLTHRGLASSFAVVTAQEDDEKAAPSVDWARLATAVDTLVIMMGSASLGSVAQALIAGGRAPDTPAVSVEWGTTPEQRSVGAPLVWIDAAVREAGLGAPLLTVVGKVASLREHLSWFESQPLFGKRVLVTRTRQQTSALADLLRRAGASPVELPAIELVPLAGESEIEFVVEELEARLYTWCLFTSPNAVDYIFAHLDRTQRDARVFTGCRVAALGSATESALAKRGLRAELTAAEFTSGGLLEALPSELRGARVLVPRAEGGSPGLVDGLRARGAQVDELLLYETRAPLEVPSEIVQLIRDGKIDVATFASSSSVRNLGGLLGSDFLRLRESVVACIGPVTAATARDLGLTVHIEPQTHTIPALVEALVEHFGGAKR